MGCACAPAAQMIEGVIAYRVTIIHYLLKNLRILLNIVADTKEGGSRFEFPLFFENEFCWSGYRAVIKSEVKLLADRLYPPGKLWVEPRQKERVSKKIHHESNLSPIFPNF